MSSIPTTYSQMLRFFFSGSGPLSMACIVILALILKFFFFEWVWSDLVFLAFVVVFRGGLEWLSHSCLLHANPLPVLNVRLRTRMNTEHALHHQRPYDFSIIMTTYKGAIAGALFAFSVAFIISGSLDLAIGVVLVYSFYSLVLEAVHLVCHCDIRHKATMMKKLVSLHRYHHQCEMSSSFGVTSSMGDRVMGTYVKEECRFNCRYLDEV